ncbi:hypothetical protein M153_9500027073, partial [Pseudoloma neurophilia]
MVSQSYCYDQCFAKPDLTIVLIYVICFSDCFDIIFKSIKREIL